MVRVIMVIVTVRVVMVNGSGSYIGTNGSSDSCNGFGDRNAGYPITMPGRVRAKINDTCTSHWQLA